jgi:hypothetical protein
MGLSANSRQGYRDQLMDGNWLSRPLVLVPDDGCFSITAYMVRI